MAGKDDFFSKKISPDIGGGKISNKSSRLTSSFDLVEQMQFLYIGIIRAINCLVDPRTGICCPFVEITLRNYMATHGVEPSFAFDKTKGDILEVVLKDGRFPDNPVIGKRMFKLAADIPTRVRPDARIAPQWYTLANSDNDNPNAHAELLMSAWFGTQADEVYSVAWFSDASGVSGDCMINMRPKVYVAPRLCYVRVHIVSAHDLIPADVTRKPEAYVKVVLGDVSLKSKISSGTHLSWNQDLMFVASDPLDDTFFISLMDRLDDQHEECMGKLKKKLSEIVAFKTLGSSPALFYDIEPLVKIEPGFKKNFTSKIKMKLSTEQTYHVFDESSQYCSDHRSYVKNLWPGQLGALEIGILGAASLQPMKTWKDVRKSTDAYVVAKYGNKWVRTRTVVDSLSPK